MAAEMTEQVMVRLTPDMYELLKAESERDERSIAQTVRLAIKRYLSELSAAPS
jgi:predicted DNA-binding protein